MSGTCRHGHSQDSRSAGRPRTATTQRQLGGDREVPIAGKGSHCLRQDLVRAHRAHQVSLPQPAVAGGPCCARVGLALWVSREP